MEGGRGEGEVGTGGLKWEPSSTTATATANGSMGNGGRENDEESKHMQA